MTRRIRLFAALVVLAWLAIAGVGGPLVGKLSALQKNDQASFLPVAAESKKAGDQLAPFRAGAGLPYFVVITRDGGLQPQDMATIQAYVEKLARAPLAEGQGSLADLLTEPPRAAIPSQDGQAALVPITADGDKAAGKVGDSTGGALIAQTLREEADRTVAPAGLQTYVTGPGGFLADLSKAFAGIDGILIGVALGVVLVILLIVYRSPILPFAVLMSAILGLAAAAVFIYPLAQADIIEVSGQSQGILSILVVGAATDYALLIVARYREELHHTESTWQAMKAAWRGTVEPITASATTVVIALLCLLLAELGGTRGLGPISALGIIGALAGALTFLPAVLLLFGRRIFWPRMPQVDRDHAAAEQRRRGGPWAVVARSVGAHPRAIWLGVAALLAVAAAFAPTFKADGLDQSQVFRTEVDSVVGERVLEAHFPGGTGQPAQMVVPVERAEQVIAAAKGIDGVGSAATSAAPGAPPRVIDGKVVVQATLTDAAASPAAQDTLVALRDAVHRVDPGLAVGGQTATVVDTRAASDRDVLVLLPTILLIVFVVLIVLLRSLVAAVVLVLANVLSFAATIGISALVFNHVFGFPNADPATPLYGFVFLIALGIDYSIFLMTRIREEAPARGTREATLVGLAVTGGVITSAGVVLAATFSALLVLPLVFLAQIAFLVAFGVLLDTLVVRSLLLPGLVYDLGDRIWWPGRPHRKRQDSS